MPNLSDVVKEPGKRRAVIDDCAKLIDAEVHDKGGLSGAAIKLAYASVKNIRPGTIEHAMEGLLEPTLREVRLGAAEVRDTFKISKVGTIAGCLVQDGKVTLAAQVRLLRDNVVIHTGKVSSL